MLARVTPGPVGFDIRTFECPACKHVHQTVAELIGDPMKHLRTNVWLRESELHAVKATRLPLS